MMISKRWLCSTYRSAKNIEAAEFVVKTSFLNPIHRVDAIDNFKKLEERIVEKIERVRKSA